MRRGLGPTLPPEAHLVFQAFSLGMLLWHVPRPMAWAKVGVAFQAVTPRPNGPVPLAFQAVHKPRPIRAFGMGEGPSPSLGLPRPSPDPCELWKGSSPHRGSFPSAPARMTTRNQDLTPTRNTEPPGSWARCASNIWRSRLPMNKRNPLGGGNCGQGKVFGFQLTLNIRTQVTGPQEGAR